MDGDHFFDSKESILEWRIDQVNIQNANGNMEFEMDQWKADASNLFPIQVNFTSNSSLCGVSVLDATVDGNTTKFSVRSQVAVAKYVIE